MFYANNEQVKGIFLNGRNYNYLAYGFGKIIPEDRSAVQLNLNLADKYLNQYRIEFGTVKDGYDNALVSPRLDKPDSNGVFHTPFTYYYNGNIVSTKEVPVLITNCEFALSNALVYSDMNINGAINYFAINTDFQGHNVNVFPEKDNYQSAPLLYYEMLNNCSNFDLNIETRFSKSGYPTLYNCNNFSGNFRYVGNQDRKYTGFMGFLYECKDGVFNIDCTNMHGGGSSANVINCYNFSCISNSNNIKLNINGSPWQAWVHPNCYSSNCNINTRYIVPGFDRMRDCNFKFYIPSHADVEKSAYYSILSNSYNCNVYFDGTNSNLYSFRNGDWKDLFEDLNNCNINLALSNSTGLDYSFGNRLNNCNIQFDNLDIEIDRYGWLNRISNCNVYGSVIKSNIMGTALITESTNVNLNVNASSANMLWPIWMASNINGNIILGNLTWMNHSNNLILNLYNGNTLEVENVSDSKLTLNNVKVVDINGAYDTNFNLYNAAGYSKLYHLDNVKFVERGGANYTVTNLDNCRNSWISANTVSGTIENAYNMRLELVNNNAEFTTWRVDKCEITGFPTSAAYTTSCTFNTSISQMTFRWNSNNGYVTWNNIWPHATPRGSEGWNTWYRTKAGLRSVDNFSRCYLIGDNGSLLYHDGSETFNKINNMQTDIKTFYNGIVTANLPNYNMNIKLNVDCSTLNLGIFQAGPPHGFQNATVSANDIYAKGDMPSAYVQVNCDTKIYCENYCNVCFSPYVSNINSALQPVILINNYDHYNTGTQSFFGGITRIGRQSTRTGPISLSLYAGAFVFINNAVLARSYVGENSVLFLGSNVSQTNGITVESGGLIVNKENWGSHASEIRSRIDRGHLAWNVWDYGPWGSMSLLDFCTNV